MNRLAKRSTLQKTRQTEQLPENVLNSLACTKKLSNEPVKTEN